MAFPFTNLLLDAIPAADRSELLAKFEPVDLPVEAVLFEPEEVPRYIHLVTSGIASVVASMAGGDAVEVGLIGREGVAGGIYLLGAQTGLTRCFMQVPGAGLRMEFGRFRQEFLRNEILRERVLQYVQYEALILGQLSACNRLHEVEERLARWLLMVEDRIEQPELPLTQEFLAEMLGTRRTTVTVVAGTLQRSGLIEYHRGRVKVLDREGLENAACECYGFTRKLYDNLYREPARGGKQGDGNGERPSKGETVAAG